MGNIGTWQLLIVAAVILVLFGAKRLPEAARGLGRSLKIFKAETKGLIEDDKDEKDDSVVEPTDQQPARRDADARAVEPTKVEPAPAEPVNDAPRRDA